MIQIERHDVITEIRLDRPPANALSPELLSALAEALQAAPEQGARGIVLSGAPGMFSAGLDVPHFLELDRDQVAAAWRALFETMRALVASPVPVACALTGHAPAGGCVLALCCDWRILAEGKYKIGLNEVQVGVRAPEPILAVARHVVGSRQAERMLVTAELFGAEKAARIGLVDELAPQDEVVPLALQWAEHRTKLPPETLRKTRALARKEVVETIDAMDGETLSCFLDEWFGDECQGALRALVAALAAKKKG